MPKRRWSPSGIAKIERDRHIIDLRKAGFGFEKIAAQLGCKPYVCRKVISNAMRALIEIDQGALEEILQLELERTNDMLMAIWPDVLSGDLRATLVALKIQERRAKFLGLDAAERMDVSVSGGLMIQTETPESAAEDIRERMAEMRTRLLEAPDGGVATNGHAGGG